MHITNVNRLFGVLFLLASAAAGTWSMTACSGKQVAGGVIGGAAVGGAYEYQNKEALDELERDREAGRISEDEYQRRRAEIEERSLLY